MEGELIPQSGAGHTEGPVPKGLKSGAGGCQLIISRGPEVPQGGARMEEVREVNGGPEHVGTCR